jgi:nicotinate-nucleotide--dimethylbenzimidazole phosphoribosyltransferase
MLTETSVTDADLRKRLQQIIDNKTKPVGALGKLEQIALQVGLIQHTSNPIIRKPYIVVFAGDHGIAKSGLVNPYPQAVTAQMVLNFLRGGAAINVFCRQHALGLRVVDAGVNVDFEESLSSPKLVRKKIGHGTRNYLEGDAMSREEASQAIQTGKKIVEDLSREGCNCIGLGEMGIGNTSSAALIMSYITGIPVEECAGKGTGVNDIQLATKKATLRTAFQLHLSSVVPSPVAETILQHVGGFEIAMMTGAYLKAAELKMIILVDGFITTAALLLARLINPAVTDYCIYSHTSGEQGHERMLQYLGAEPLLNLGMRLGEGTGAAMAFPLVQSAVSFLHEMASFESAGISKE